MNMILVVLSVFVGIGTSLASFPILSLAAMANNSDAMVHPVICIAAALSLIVGVIMARRNSIHAVKVLWASVILYVLALMSDELGFYVGAWIGGVIWSGIALTVAIRARKKQTEVKEG